MEEVGGDVTGVCEGEGESGGGEESGVQSRHEAGTAPQEKQMSVEEEFRARRREEKNHYSNIPQLYQGYEALLDDEEEEEGRTLPSQG